MTKSRSSSMACSSCSHGPRGDISTFATALGGDLEPTFRRGRGGPGGWILLSEPELHLARNVFVPDWAGGRRAGVRHVWLIDPA